MFEDLALVVVLAASGSVRDFGDKYGLGGGVDVSRKPMNGDCSMFVECVLVIE